MNTFSKLFGLIVFVSIVNIITTPNLYAINPTFERKVVQFKELLNACVDGKSELEKNLIDRLFIENDNTFVYDFISEEKQSRLYKFLTVVRRFDFHYDYKIINSYHSKNKTIIGIAKFFTVKSKSAQREAILVFVIDDIEHAQIKEIYLFSDLDKDGIDIQHDECPKTATGVHVTVTGCVDSDKDKIPDFQDACKEVKGDIIFCGCPEENVAKLAKKKGLFKMHSDTITSLKYGNGILLSGSSSGEIRASQIVDECLDEIKDYSIKINDYAIDFSIEDSRYFSILTNQGIIPFSLNKNVEGQNQIIFIEEPDKLIRIDNYLFIKNLNKWGVLNKKFNISYPAFDIKMVGTSGNGEVAYLINNQLSIFKDNPLSPVFENEFSVSITDDILAIESFSDSSWAIINNMGKMELINNKCNCSSIELTHKKIKSIKSSKEIKLIAILFDDYTWEVWKKHSNAPSWKRMKLKKKRKKRYIFPATAIEVSSDGSYFFEGDAKGNITPYKIRY